MPPRTIAEKWRGHAQAQAMRSQTARIGAWLIDVMQADARNGDKRLQNLLGLDYYERMMRFGINKPQTAERVWRYMIERRRLPERKTFR
ncbi:hypothetical protein GCM10010082_31400 [Kushneria pakistanensis]|uniref:Uncharacterized protein n=1 Tax=Kushneria pakistanensis TaxID=1508770 RepID=A0ABQ3FQM7_9GAMM|nr:hypothetical protein [Kushneria pakistanensis]GHC34460.1 hypothetical protein GCM10010082_31400 [Kushneria pakistanensis]